ncbi:hypothetical protein BGW42_006069 [Actinomortierella wolfii]|nr:hypothetical protein BGW42_006069 [Actinomortierella wolfii]
MVLNHVETKFEIRSSSYIFAYYLITIAGTAIQARSMLGLSKSQEAQFKCYTTFLGLIAVSFIVEALPRGRTTVQAQSGASDYDKANLFSRISFHYFQRIVSKAYRRDITLEDIEGMAPAELHTAHIYPRLARGWDAYLAKTSHTKRSYERKPSLLWFLISSFGFRWVQAVLLRYLLVALTFVSPQLLSLLLTFIQSYSATNKEPVPQPLELGIILAFGMFLASMMVVVIQSAYVLLTINMGSEIRTGLIAMMYRKSLHLTGEAKQKLGSGKITNHMSIDAECWPRSASVIDMVSSLPLEIGLAIWMLHRQLGWCVFVGLATVIAMIPLQGYLAKRYQVARKQKLGVTDTRIRVMNEILSNIKTVKLYGWEEPFQKRIQHIRESEIQALRRLGINFSCMSIIFSGLSMVVSLVTFVVYALVGGPNFTRGDMSPQVVFVSITLFGLLSNPITTLGQIMSELVGLRVSTKRIEAFLLAEEIDTNNVESFNYPQIHDPMFAVIEIRDGTFAWNREHSSEESLTNNNIKSKDNAQPALAATIPQDPTSLSASGTSSCSPTLQDIRLSIFMGSLTAVVGRIGMGKSSLLSAIIGEMWKQKGSVKVFGRIAYVPQQAWIINATVRDNIVFGMPFDQEKYDRIIYAAGLQPDLEMLPAGDQTEIGERGINLSGGQKQRVSLARAAYQDADVYLLDDPLSAVDAHVDQHLWENLIGPNGLLKDKTRLLVTHGIHHLEQVDSIVLIKNGKISENGKYDELLTHGKDFAQLIFEYSVQRRHDGSGDSKGDQQDECTKDEIATHTSETTTPTNPTQHSGRSTTHTAATHPKDSKQEKTNSPEVAAKLVEKEHLRQDSVKWSLYGIYLNAASIRYSLLVVATLLVCQAFQVGTNIWLEYWTRHPERYSVGTFLGIYTALMVAYLVTYVAAVSTINLVAAIRASREMHGRLLSKLLRLPMAFFDTTPTGRVMNRCSSDMASIDEGIPFAWVALSVFSASVLGTMVAIALSTPLFLVVVPPIGACYILLHRYYVRCARAVRRIQSITKSPLYSHFSETLQGVSTIRAMGLGNTFAEKSDHMADTSANAFFAFAISTRWLNIRLQALASTIILATALFAVMAREQLHAGMVGLALSYALTVTTDMSWVVKSACDLQNQMVAVERVEEYRNLNSEAPSEMEGDRNLPENWPQQGHIIFKNYSARYREGLEPVIKHLSLEVHPGEKIGIIGRTGAGKSSLTLALFRIIEAADGHWDKASHNRPNTLSDNMPLPLSEQHLLGQDGGSIWIDGVDISTVGLRYLRQHLAIIPQDPTLFDGTFRENLDPFSELQDADLWEALERAHLRDHVASLPGGLDFKVSQNGDNFSVGQRSLLCLARALLRKTKILVLDEATSSVDMQTDELIQQTIRNEFKDRTILTIAHRIKTIMDSDKILVLEQGEVREFGTPASLLENRASLFCRLATQAGEL